jgi:hypothetical protein
MVVTPPETIWTNWVVPPPPKFVFNPGEPFGLVTTTLPTDVFAEAVAAAVAAVERSPATAAKAFWNSPFLKLATVCWMSRAEP